VRIIFNSCQVFNYYNFILGNEISYIIGEIFGTFENEIAN